MSIPASQLVQVNPGVLAAAGSAIDLNGLILTQSSYPPIGSMLSFSTAADVGAYFGLTSAEYEAALIYFAGPNNATATPGLLYFSQYPAAAVPAYLRSAKQTLTLAQLNALTGTLIITINGTANTSASINLSTATSFSNAATLIQAGFTAPLFSVTYDAQQQAFVFTSTLVGATATATFATGTLADSLNLTAATGAVVSQGAAAVTPSTAMSAAVIVNQNWASFTTAWEPVTADKTAFSAWTALQNNRFVYVGYDSDPNAKVAGNTTTWGYAVKQAADNGTVPIFGDLTHAAFVLGVIASVNFASVNGRITPAYKSQSGLLASISNASDADALLANGYNFYGAYATANSSFTFFYPGSISGQWLWVDSYVNQIWLNAQLQLSMFTLLQSVGSIPYNAEGYALVDAAVMDPINAAINFGAIRKGVQLSAAQIQELRNAVGSDVSQAVMTNGYYLQIVPATAAIRVARSSPAMNLYYADGGSIQQLKLASIEIQ